MSKHLNTKIQASPSQNLGSQTVGSQNLEFQNVFVRIAADAGFRQAFFADPVAMLQGLPLSERAQKALRGIPHDAFERYAESLLAKRGRELTSVLPLTVKICPSLGQRYRQWLALHPAPKKVDVLSPGLREGLRALNSLAQELRADPGEASYAADVLSLELLSAASRVDGQERRILCRFRADRLLMEIEQGRIPMDPKPAPCQFRVHGGGVLWQPVAQPLEHET